MGQSTRLQHQLIGQGMLKVVYYCCPQAEVVLALQRTSTTPCCQEVSNKLCPPSGHAVLQETSHLHVTYTGCQMYVPVVEGAMSMFITPLAAHMLVAGSLLRPKLRNIATF